VLFSSFSYNLSVFSFAGQYGKTIFEVSEKPYFDRKLVCVFGKYVFYFKQHAVVHVGIPISAVIKAQNYVATSWQYQ